MKLVEMTPTLHLLHVAVGHAYLWHERDALTLIDTSTPGSGGDIEGAIRSLGFSLGDLRRIIVTHGHEDHHGALAEIAADATVMVHRAAARTLLSGPESRTPLTAPPATEGGPCSGHRTCQACPDGLVSSGIA